MWYNGWQRGTFACTGRASAGIVCRPNLKADLIPSDVQHHVRGYSHSFSLPRERAFSRAWLLVEAWQDCAVWLQVVATPQITRKDLSQFQAVFYQWAKLLPKCISLCLVPCTCWSSVLDADRYIHSGFHRSHCIVEHSGAPTYTYLPQSICLQKSFKFRITVIQLIGAPVVTSFQ